MHKAFTPFFKRMLLALALGGGLTSPVRAQVVPQPVALTGFNADIVANGTGNTTAGSSSNSSVDANSYVFLANDYTTTTAPGFFHPAVGLPFGQTFLGAASPNVLYKLQPYTGNNSLRLFGVGGGTPAATATGTLAFTSPTAAGTLYVLATCGSGTDVTTAVVNFSDGTNQSASFTVQDWFGGAGFAYSVNNRLLITGTNFDAIIANTTNQNPRLYQYAVAISAPNQGKSITGVTFTKSATAGSYVQIMAISAAPAAAANNYVAMPLTFPAGGTPAVYNGSAFATPSVSGQDVIVDGLSGNTITAGTASTPFTNTSATADTDGAGYFLMATDYNGTATPHPTNGLPVAGINGATTTGLLTSIPTSGLTYQLASYTGINALQIRGVGSGSVSFTPTAASEVYVLTTSTNSSTSTGTLTVNFSDGTTHAYAANFNNWFSAATSATSGASNATTSIGAYAKGRLQPTNAFQASTTTPNLFEHKLVLSGNEFAKTITSITVANTSTSNAVSVLGVSLNANVASLTQCAFPTGHAAAASVAAACAGTSFTLTLNGLLARSGYSYQWQSSPDNATWNALSTSSAASPYSTGPTNATCTVLNQTAATYYRCLVQCAFDQAGTDAPSAAVRVGQTDPVNCYPYPATSTSGCGTYGAVSAVRIAETATPANVAMNKTGLTCATTSEPYATYGIYRDAAANGTLDKSKDYTLTVTTTTTGRAGLWIDLNQDGVYGAVLNSASNPSGEYFGENTNGSASANLSFAIPSTALAAVTNGTVGFRVRTERNNATVLGTPGNSNATTVTGVTLDYAILVAGATPCAGTPTATAPATTATTACPASALSLTATGPALGTTGLTYQWEYKPSTATLYTSVPATLTDVNGNAVATNATSAILTIVNQRAATDYRVTITCSNGGASATSPATAIAQSSLANCYCQNSNNATNEYITNVTLQDINNTSGSSQANTPTGFIDYTASPSATQTTTLNRGGRYAISVTALSASITPTEMVWIDYDQSGTFEASEYVFNATQGAAGPVTGSGNITIPATAALGNTRMRVRFHNDASGTSTSACANAWNGETEDYLVTIAPEIVCAGTPAAPVASASTGSTCAGSPFTLSATNPGNATGLAYQWQSSPAGAGTFTDISGATTLTYAVPSQTAATDYRLQVTCSASAQTTASNVVAVGQNSFLNCYCLPTYTNTSSSGDGIARVVLGPLSNATGYNAPYTSYTAAQTGSTPTLQIPDLVPGASASVAVTFGADGNQWGAVWIDFNQNGTFGDVANEYVAATSQTVGSGTYTFALPVPLTATAGQTRMRVRGGEDSSSPSQSQACGASSSSYGEGEDYLVNILATVACTGTPAATTASASASSACQSTALTLSATGIVAGTTGLSYQWQSSPAGAGTFASISGATTNPYTLTGQTAATDYRLQVTCTASAQTTASNVVAVGQNAFSACYGTPTGGDCTNEYIRSVTLNTLSNVGTGTPGTGCTGNGYTDYTANSALTTTLNKGTAYTISLNLRINSNPAGAGIWIDYDHSGSFEASEYTSVYSNTATASNLDVSGSASFTIPASALTGATRLRVRSANSSVPISASTATPLSPYYGEVEDYLVTLAAPLPVELIAFSAEAQGSAVRLAWSTASEKNSKQFDVERSADGKTFEPIGTVAAQGNSARRVDYEFLDTKALAKAATRYYRLRQVDLDGSAAYSPVRSVQTGGGSHLELYPNPAHSAATLTGAQAGASVQVFDVLNRLVLAVKADATGQATLALPANLPTGVYLVRTGREVVRLLH